jgi:hypothetical protein
MSYPKFLGLASWWGIYLTPNPLSEFGEGALCGA